MSDLMLTAVLSMPYDMAMADDLSRRQFYDRAQQALEVIERLTAERDELRRQLAEPKREPLSDDEIGKLAWKQNLWTDHMIEFSFLAFAREVERAHGIGGGGSDAE